jgi:hypothetical protein
VFCTTEKRKETVQSEKGLFASQHLCAWFYCQVESNIANDIFWFCVKNIHTRAPLASSA